MISDDESCNSDEELQEAFAAGKLKPGLNIPVVETPRKNNKHGMEKKLEEIKLDLPWVERLDINTVPAPMAPEMFHEISQKEKDNVVKLKSHIRKTPGKSEDLALDDFKREMLFHRQAQAALLEGVKRLTSLGIPTQRPEDYFAEMAKSDQHMHKVRESLAARQKGLQRSERVSELRRQRKLSKQTQIEAKLNQAKEKKKMLTEVKKFRKGVRKDLDFLDGKDSAKGESGKDKKDKKSAYRAAKKRKFKDEKYGMGGKKRGMKRNTKESFAAVGSRKPGNIVGRGGKRAKKGSKMRPGKSKRVKARGRK